MIELSKNEKIIICIILAIIISIIGYYIYVNLNDNESYIEDDDSLYIEENYTDVDNETNVNKSEENIIIHIAGCVENEGVYEVKKNSRISDAIDIAGGLTSDANTKNINLAQKLNDGQKIYIPNKKEKISKMYTKGKDYIFEDFSINEKMIEFEELINTGKINNIDEHKYLIKTELDPLEEKINEAIKNKKCTKKVE